MSDRKRHPEKRLTRAALGGLISLSRSAADAQR